MSSGRRAGHDKVGKRRMPGTQCRNGGRTGRLKTALTISRAGGSSSAHDGC